MKKAVLRELFIIIKQKIKIQLILLWLNIKTNYVLILSCISLIMSIIVLFIIINFQITINKKINDIEKKLLPEHEIIKKFDKVYF